MPQMFLSFVHNSCCIISECEVVKFVIIHGLYCGRMFSFYGRNAILCSLRYDFNLSDILHTNFSANVVKERCSERISDDDFVVINILMELVYIGDNVFVAPELSRSDINGFIEALCCI